MLRLVSLCLFLGGCGCAQIAGIGIAPGAYLDRGGKTLIVEQTGGQLQRVIVRYQRDGRQVEETWAVRRTSFQ